MVLDIGKREVDDELEKLVGGKKQKRDEVIENQKKEAKVHCYYTRKSKVAATTGNNEPTATEPKAESSFEHENSSSDRDVNEILHVTYCLILSKVLF